MSNTTEQSFYKTKSKKQDILKVLEELKGVFTTNLLSWLAFLFDPNIGGFYYSKSAKNSDVFLPDIESTNQAIQLLVSTGVLNSYDEIPAWMKRKITFFICSLENPENGFFYHPQWSKKLSESNPVRLSRDLSAALNLSETLGFKFPFDPITNKGRSISDNNFLDYLTSEEALISYLEQREFNIGTVHFICSQREVLRTAGLLDAVCSWLLSKQNEDTGLWTDADDPDAVRIFHAVIDLFYILKRQLPNAHKATSYIIKFMLSEDVIDICHMMNAWRGLQRIIQFLKLQKTKEADLLADKVQCEIIDNAIETLENTKRILIESKKSDGSFSYLPNRTVDYSQGMPVSVPHTNEGDINSTLLAIRMMESVYKTLALEEEYVFAKNDFEVFLENIND